MKPTILKGLALVVMAMLLFTSCTKEYFQPFPEPDVVSYSTNIQPYFNQKCTSCHGLTPPNLEAPNSYNNLINGGYIDLAKPENSLLYTKIAPGGTMAPYSSSSETSMTLKWIKQGALNN